MEVEEHTSYLCDDGDTAASVDESEVVDCDDKDRTNTGSTQYILLSRGYYWKNGPMAGLYIDSRGLDRPYKRRGEDIIFPEPCSSQLALFD